uniref:Uncharacterized protein n=1 Tax=Rhizophora mucronata TaxID=61149 RepID=A0A2P2NTV5_RHIMU
MVVRPSICFCSSNTITPLN